MVSLSQTLEKQVDIRWTTIAYWVHRLEENASIGKSGDRPQDFLALLLVDRRLLRRPRSCRGGDSRSRDSLLLALPRDFCSSCSRRCLHCFLLAIATSYTILDRCRRHWLFNRWTSHSRRRRDWRSNRGRLALLSRCRESQQLFFL